MDPRERKGRPTRQCAARQVEAPSRYRQPLRQPVLPILLQPHSRLPLRFLPSRYRSRPPLRRTVPACRRSCGKVHRGSAQRLQSCHPSRQQHNRIWQKPSELQSTALHEFSSTILARVLGAIASLSVSIVHYTEFVNCFRPSEPGQMCRRGDIILFPRGRTRRLRVGAGRRDNPPTARKPYTIRSLFRSGGCKFFAQSRVRLMFKRAHHNSLSRSRSTLEGELRKSVAIQPRI